MPHDLCCTDAPLDGSLHCNASFYIRLTSCEGLLSKRYNSPWSLTLTSHQQKCFDMSVITVATGQIEVIHNDNDEICHDYFEVCV